MICIPVSYFFINSAFACFFNDLNDRAVVKVSNKGGRGQRNREEIGVGATWARLDKNRHVTRAMLAFNEVT